MEISEIQQNLLRKLPSVDYMLEIVKTDEFFIDIPKSVIVDSIRRTIENVRNQIINKSGDITEKEISGILEITKIIKSVKNIAFNILDPNLKRIVNATGVVVHTNLGRSLISSDAIEQLTLISSRYSNLEFNLETGKRGSRYSAVDEVICEITGAEASMVVNNNAAAVLLCLETISAGKEVIVSRGELVEIGGSFRIPDVMAKSGGILKEVGSTNRTHVRDYEGAIDNETGLLLKVHTSNYSIVGFTASVSLKDLVTLGKRYHIPVMEDLGSGTFIDFSRYGLVKEPTVQESVQAGVDIITFSGDKLLGGPQAGIIVGKKRIIDEIKKNPLTRALRIDKMTLAALESTLKLYRDEEKALNKIPTLKMLTMPFNVIEAKADQLGKMLESINDPRLEVMLLDLSSKTGGGSLPIMDLPSKCVGIRIRGMSANVIEKFMRNNMPPVIGRIEDDIFIMDLRTIQEDELSIIEKSIDCILKKG
ncbi:MAG: L-seryl-tRNA(Sec) selenium transferase [Desulfobacteraceae bacterium]|nr:L-seryl-tRNA(Sec) selenium transferase [Desulfobacteraceae bacterium]